MAALRVDGLDKLQRALRRAGETDVPKRLKQVAKDAAQLVADEAARRTPVKTGRLRNSIRAAGQAKQGLVRMGTSKVPYAGPIDFGGYPKGRPFKSKGRILYPALDAASAEVERFYERAIDDALKDFM